MRRGNRTAAAVASLLVAQPCAQARTTISTFSEAIIINPDERHAGPIDGLGDIGRAIAACWHPPDRGVQVTVRLSFRRNGSVFGRPLITFGKATAGGLDGRTRLATSILGARAACDPLPFTDRLGASVAGRVFLIRLIAAGSATTASP